MNLDVPISDRLGVQGVNLITYMYIQIQTWCSGVNLITYSVGTIWQQGSIAKLILHINSLGPIAGISIMVSPSAYGNLYGGLILGVIL